MKSFMAKPAQVERKWHVIDAEGQVLGRLASQVAAILRGKNKPIYTPHVDTGDHVIIINADKIVLTGKKLTQKMYYRHTGYVGGLKEVTCKRLMETKPDFVIREAIRGMLPHNSLGRQMIKKLRIYAGPDHGHQAQQPETLTLTY